MELMKKHLLLTLLSVVLTATATIAGNRTTPPEPASTVNIYNPDSIISHSAAESLRQDLEGLYNNTGIHSVVIAVKQVSDDNLYDKTIKIARKYNPGDTGLDSCLIIAIDTSKPSCHIIRGEAIRDMLSDATLYDIENNHMMPNLKDGLWDEALRETSLFICIEFAHPCDDYVESIGINEDKPKISPIGALLFPILVLAVGYALIHSRKKRCPNCSKKTLKLVSYKTLHTDQHYKYRKAIYRCTNCGHEITKNRRKPIISK